MITAMLIDDMPQAIQVLKSDLAEYCPEVQVIQTADSIVSAAKILRTAQPDLLFLDISLADGTGFDLLEIFPNLSSKVIFVTASEEHAIKAFRFSAIDYLLKPIEPETLIQAVKRAIAQLSLVHTQSLDLLKETLKSPEKLPERLSLHSLDKISIVEISEIVQCEAAGNNTLFCLQNGEQILVTKTLKHFEELLREHSFMRVHQSHLVNYHFIQEFIKKEGGFLRLRHHKELIPVASRKRAEVLDFLEKM